MRFYNKAPDHAFEHYVQVRNEYHAGIVWQLWASMAFDNHHQGDKLKPIVRGKDCRNIDQKLLKDTEHMERWIEEIRTEVEQSLIRSKFDFDSLTLTASWPYEDAPWRAQFDMQLHRTVPEPEKVSWFRRLFAAKA